MDIKLRKSAFTLSTNTADGVDSTDHTAMHRSNRDREMARSPVFYTSPKVQTIGNRNTDFDHTQILEATQSQDTPPLTAVKTRGPTSPTGRITPPVPESPAPFLFKYMDPKGEMRQFKNNTKLRTVERYPWIKFTHVKDRPP